MRRLGGALYALAGVSFVSALTGIIFGPQWIERLVGFEPDGGSGSLEVVLVVVPAVAALLLLAGGYTLRRLATRSSL